MATGMQMPTFNDPKSSPAHDTSDLFGDDEADTNSESDDFEEVSIPNGPVQEVIDVEEEEDDDFLPSRADKYAPLENPATSPKVPPAKRRREDSPQQPTTRQSAPSAPPPQSIPSAPTYFNPSSGRNERLAPSIIDSEPLDEFSQVVGDWIEHFTQGLNPEHVEIEAKLGIIIDKGSNARLCGLSMTECILPPNLPIDTRFESNMPLQAHKHFNQLLNKLVASGQHGIKYSHTKLIDEFYVDGNTKTRVTRDDKQNVVASVRKRRIADMDVHSPKQGVDWRISISLEEPAPAPGGKASHTRRKDRISYTHQAFKIDLTQVTSSHGPQLLHELEVEFCNAAQLLRHRGRRLGANAFDDLVRVFVNNIRIMVRNSA